MSQDGDNGKVLPFPRRRKSPHVTGEMAKQMREMYQRGMVQHDIAAHFGVNQGRVSEAVNRAR